MKNVIINLAIFAIGLLLLIIWVVSGFPFRYVGIPNLYAVLFDSVLFVGLIRSIQKFKKNKELSLILLLLLLFFSVSMINKIDPEGDCVEIGKVWNNIENKCEG